MSPKKSLGQNFLIDRRYVNRILSTASLQSSDIVLEIGPGKGILTKNLAKLVEKVYAVEIDETLCSNLEAEFADQGHVKIINADARDVDTSHIGIDHVPYKFVANLPYYAAMPIVRRFLEFQHRPELMVIMVQKEVAQSMTASPGDMTLLSVATQVFGSPRIVCNVPPKAFRPRPKITSSLVCIDVYESPLLPEESLISFFTLVRAGFSSRRKQIHNSLKNSLNVSATEIELILANASIDLTRRPQTLSVSEWGGLHRAFLLHCGNVEAEKDDH